MIWVITFSHFLITWNLSKMPREFISLSLPGNHCSSAAKFPLLCNFPKGEENTMFFQNLDCPPLSWYIIDLEQQLDTGDQIVVFVARFSQELSDQRTPRM